MPILLLVRDSGDAGQMPQVTNQDSRVFTEYAPKELYSTLPFPLRLRRDAETGCASRQEPRKERRN